MSAAHEAALVRRINRVLARSDEKVVKLRGRKAEEHGTYVRIPIPSVADVLGWGRHGPPSNFEPVNNLQALARWLAEEG